MPWTIFYVRRVHAGFNQRCRHQRLDFVRVKIRHGFFLVRRRGKKFFTAAESATFPDMVVPQTCPDQNRFRTVRDWCLRHPRWMLTLLTVVSLAPFLAKPFNIDDPLFIWAAEQIHSHPFNPYGFDVNWYGMPSPMWNVTQNPPLACYYLALAAGIFGWSETALHAAFLLPAVAVVLGTHRLARHFCRRPVLAALATLFTPVFLVSSTTVMCDVLMLAFWVWAIVFWVEGMEQNNFRKLSGAGLLIAAAALTKYFGMALLPLLAVHALIEKRGAGRWFACLMIPLAVMGEYQWTTHALYGRALFSQAIDYTGHAQDFFAVPKMAPGLTALIFTGGCVASAVFFAPLFWRTARSILTAFGIFGGGMLLEKYALPRHAEWAPVEFQIIFWMAGGAAVLALAVAEVLHRRNSHSWLLMLWVSGTFVFAAFFNWTINGRSILPMTPAVGILIACRLERNAPVNRKNFPCGITICLAASALLALLVARADFLLAVAAREGARQVCAKYGGKQGTLWFQGHWGFQYYMDKLGAKAVDMGHAALKSGDILALPADNTNLLPPDFKTATLQETFVAPGPHLLMTEDVRTSAGFFYAPIPLMLPFAFDGAPPESVAVYRIK